MRSRKQAVNEGAETPPAADNAALRAILEEDKPMRQVSPAEWFALQDAYPDKSGLVVYVYRLWPVIVRPPRQKAILKTTPPFTEKDLLRQFGSGDYQLRLNDSNRQPGERFRTVIHLKDPDSPPVVDVDELDMGNRENGAFITDLKARGLLKAEDTEDMGEATAAAMKEMAGVVREVVSKKEPAKPDDSPVLLKFIEQQNTLTRELIQARNSGPDPLLVKMIEGQNAIALELMKARGTPAAAAAANPAPDPLEQMDRALDLASKVQKFGGGGGGTDWGEVLKPLLAGVTMLLQPLLVRAMQAQAQAPAVPSPAVPAAPLLAPGAEVVPAAAPAAPAPANPPAANGSNDQMSFLARALGVDERVIPHLTQLGPAALHAYQSGVPGKDFAAFSVPGGVYDCLAGMGKENLLELFGMFPQTAQLLAADRAGVEAWIDSFLSYADEGSETEDSAQ